MNNNKAEFKPINTIDTDAISSIDEMQKNNLSSVEVEVKTNLTINALELALKEKIMEYVHKKETHHFMAKVNEYDPDYIQNSCYLSKSEKKNIRALEKIFNSYIGYIGNTYIGLENDLVTEVITYFNKIKPFSNCFGCFDHSSQLREDLYETINIYYSSKSEEEYNKMIEEENSQIKELEEKLKSMKIFYHYIRKKKDIMKILKKRSSVRSSSQSDAEEYDEHGHKIISKSREEISNKK